MQAASFDVESRFSLQGTYGLYCSDDWWHNLKYGPMPTKCVSGIIIGVYVTGMDNIADETDFELLLEDGSKWTESCYANNQNYRHFHVGCRVDIFYALDPLKR